MTVPNSPFVGLAAFTPHMAAYFTGRERFALTLAGAVLRSRVTVMYGQSGCGKSSVLGAALPQVIRATLHDADEAVLDEPFRLLHFRRWHPGFETRLFHAAAAKLGAPKDADLVAAVAGWGRDQDHKAPVILVLDQFEEFLLYHPKPTETSLVQALATLVADPDIEAHVLLSLREDSLASLDALRAVIPGILSSPVQLRPLDHTAAEQAIRKPVAKWSEDRLGDPKSIEVEDSLVESLLDQVRQSGPGASSAEAMSNPAASFVDLPLMQLTLERLWEEEARSDKPVLQLRTLEQLGGAAGIARRHLDQILETLPAPRRALAIRLFRHLVTTTGGKHAWRADDLANEIDANRQAARQATERTVLGSIGGRIARVLLQIGAVRSLFRSEKEPIGPDATKAAVIDTLNKLAEGKARILRTQPDPRGHGPLFELYHDALAHPVLSWVQEARIKEAERRQRRRVWVALGVAMLMMAGSVVFYSLYHRANIQQEQAQLLLHHAVSNLARQAAETGDAMTGMLAALAILPENLTKPNQPYSNAAAAALLEAWSRNRERHGLIGHTGPIRSVVFSPDGRRVVTGSADNTARVWDLSGATPAATLLEGHRKAVNSVAFSPEGQRVVTGSDDSTARMWDLSRTPPAATPLEGHREAVRSVAFSPDGRRVVTGSKDTTARVWDLSGATPAATVLEGHRGPVTSVAFSPDGRRVVTGSEDKTARVWDLSGAPPAATVLAGHSGTVWSVAFSPDGKRVVTGSEDNTARVWDLSGAAPAAATLEGHSAAVRSVAFSPDGRRVVTGSDDNTARVWDLSGAAPAATPLEGHRGPVFSVAFSPDGRRVVTGCLDNTARVWDLSGAIPAATPLEGHRGWVWSVAFSPDGQRVVTGSEDNTARVWDLSGAAPAATLLEGHRKAVNSVAFSPEGRRVVTGSDDSTARMWDLSRTPPAFTVLEGHRGPVWSVAFSPDGRRVVTGSDDSTARVWDLSSATPAATLLEGHTDWVRSVAFSPDGKRVVTGSDDKTARVWDLSGAIPASTVLEGHSGWVRSVAFSPDGKRVVTGSKHRTARLWDLSGAVPVATPLEGHRGPVRNSAFSPDGRSVVTGSEDSTARVWDLSGAAPVATPLEGHHGGWVMSVAFSPDGRRVVTGSFDNTARVWDLSGATPAATPLEGHRVAVFSVAFSPDGRRVVTGSYDNTARVWETPPIEELIPQARAALTRCLTIAQREALGLPVIPGTGQDREHIDPPPCP